MLRICLRCKNWERLKEYEDTGLTPEGVREIMTDKLPRMAKRAKKEN